MQTFLEKVAEKILEKHSNELHQVCVVTPNRRAVLFLTRHFSHLIQKASWAPDVISMEDFVSRCGDVTISEPVNLLLDFYRVYKQVEGEQAEPLEEFLKWAPMLIRDFNDIDAHVPEPEKLFENVLDLKNVEAWNPDGSPPSEFQKKYLRFFGKFKAWHLAFKEHLASRRTAYQGLAYLWAARAIVENKATIPWEKIYFAGFNALNHPEEIIIRTLTRKGKGQIFWDADKYYLNNRNHEAGSFLRKYKESWGQGEMEFTGDYFSMVSKKIHIYGLAKNVNQAKLAGNILSTFSENEIRDHQSAVVLANEELLLPMMNSIPGNISKVNITMGYPLRKTSLYSFFDAVFQMHLTTQRMKSAREGLNTAWYHKDLIRFFSHPITILFWNTEMPSSGLQDLVKKINKTNKTFLTFGALKSMSGVPELFEEKFGFLFQSFALVPANAISTLQRLSGKLDDTFRQAAELKQTKVEQAEWFTDFEALQPVSVILRKLDSLISENNETHDIKLIFMLFQAMARESRLPLSGEPLNGLQVMGMLETRNLDFKNLIILSVNEDILPAAKGSNSLIPFDVKARFGIPVYREKDAIYAYHFYRLLQRAENIYLIYNTQARDLGSSEKSRFITQLQLELPSWNPDIEITESIIALPSASETFEKEVMIPKSESIMQALDVLNNKGFSPSSLSQYIKCSLFFYFRYIAGIRETEALEETMEAKTLGQVLHEVLQALYEEQNLEGKSILPSHIEAMQQRVEVLTKEKFEKIYQGGDISSGKNLLLTRVALRYLKNYLNREKKFLSELASENRTLVYQKAEELLTAEIDTNINGQNRKINFKGFSDRIDRLDGATRIIDYKSGKVEATELKFKDWKELTSEMKLGKSFQLMMYAMLYRQSHPESGDFVPGIISLRKISSGLLTLDFPGGKEIVTSQAVDEFEAELKRLMEEIFDNETPFKRTDNEENCKNCEFRIVCNRQ